MKHPTPRRPRATAEPVAASPPAIDFKVLAESTSDVIIRCSMDGIARYVSPSVEQLLGLAPGDLVGKSHRDFILPEDLPALKTTLDLHRAGHVGGRASYRMRRPDGRIVWVETSGRSIYDPATGAEDLVVVLRDITERKALEAKLEMLALTGPSADGSSASGGKAGTTRQTDGQRERPKAARLFN